MSQALTELCSLLVKDLYGHFHAHIFETLLNHGRLQLQLLAKKSHLSLQNVRAGLGVLIQAHLVFYFTPSDGRTVYQANWPAAYNLVRAGKILRLTEREYGDSAAQIVQNLLLDGSSSLKSLSVAPRSANPADQGNAPPKEVDDTNAPPDVKQESNGDHTAVAATEAHDSSHAQGRNEVLELLADACLIRQVKTAHFETEFDSRILAETEILSSGQTWELKGAKKKQEFQAAVEKLMSERRNGKIPIVAMAQNHTNGVKRHAEEDADGSHKRQKISNASSKNSEVQLVETGTMRTTVLPTLRFSESLTVQLDTKNFDVLLRDEALASEASRCGDPSAAEVYRCLLNRVRHETPIENEPDDDDVLEAVGSEDDSSPGVELRQLCQEMRSVIRSSHHHQKDMARQSDELNGIDTARSKHYGVNGEGGPRLVNGNGGHAMASPDCEDHFQSLSEDLELQLTMLAAVPHKLTFRYWEAGRVVWKVPFKSLTRRLRDQEICRIVKVRFGEVAVRLVRILMEKGKMDERFLQEAALVTAKDARKVLAQLQKAGLIEVQEVPRETQRLPNRTYYLWFYDRDRCQQTVLERIYKSMARCLQRLEREAERERSLLAKAGRTDVKGKEERFLSKREFKAWTKWRGKEERLLGELNRLDYVVAVLRDF